MNRWDFERTVRPYVPLGSITLPGLHLRTRFGERTRFSLVQKNLLQILLKIITDFAVPQKRCKALKILGKKVESSDAQGRLREKDDRCTCHVRLAIPFSPCHHLLLALHFSELTGQHCSTG
jgi:hypothetical protein